MASSGRIAWHPGAYGAIKLELRAYKKVLRYDTEVQLNKEPMRIDLLIIRKDPGAVIDNDIGRIFAQYNIVEYKSPEDNLSFDDFCKVLCYAYFYKSDGKTVGERDEKEITITVIRESFPKKLAAQLEELGHSVTESCPGVYEVGGYDFRCQIIASEMLDDKHTGLRLLTKNLRERDFRNFVAQYTDFDHEDQANADAVLQVCVSANTEDVRQIRKDDDAMCKALEELMKDKIEERAQEYRAEGKAEGRAEGKLDTLIDLVKQKIISVKVACKQAGMSEKQFTELLNANT